MAHSQAFFSKKSKEKNCIIDTSEKDLAKQELKKTVTEELSPLTVEQKDALLEKINKKIKDAIAPDNRYGINTLTEEEIMTLCVLEPHSLDKPHWRRDEMYTVMPCEQPAVSEEPKLTLKKLQEMAAHRLSFCDEKQQIAVLKDLTDQTKQDELLITHEERLYQECLYRILTTPPPLRRESVTTIDRERNEVLMQDPESQYERAGLEAQPSPLKRQRIESASQASSNPLAKETGESARTTSGLTRTQTR